MENVISVQRADLLIITDSEVRVLRFFTKSEANAAYDNIRSTAGYLPTDAMIRVAKLYTDEPVKASSLASSDAGVRFIAGDTLDRD